MLPGGDPLAEALAAGDTPSPEMVAASDDTGALSVRGAVVCLAGVILGLVVLFALSGRGILYNEIPFPHSKDVLTQKAREMISQLGYRDQRADSFSWFDYDDAYLRWTSALRPEISQAQLAVGEPGPIRFHLRESPEPLVSPMFGVNATNPAPVAPGMVAVTLNPQGRLREFHAVPPARDTDAPAAGPIDWNAVLGAAGLNRQEWTETKPEWVPPTGFHERMAWKGSLGPAGPVRIEAAAWKGRLVAFQVQGPWRGAAPALSAFNVFFVALLLVMMLVTLALAWVNIRTRRGDMRGATRLAVFSGTACLLDILLSTHHVSSFAETEIFLESLLLSLGFGLLLWTFDAALEPHVRRRWPQSLISWSRLLANNWRDPLVAGHLLLGTLFGTGWVVLSILQTVLTQGRDIGNGNPGPNLAFLDGGGLVGFTIFAPAYATALALSLFVWLFVLRTALRRPGIASLAFVVVMSLQGLVGATHPASMVFDIVGSIGFLWIMTRFGVLPMVTAFLVRQLGDAPITWNFSAWYSIYGLILTGLTVALALWSFRYAVGGRKIWAMDMLDN
jgi:serine/threonine-protein kinase